MHNAPVARTESGFGMGCGKNMCVRPPHRGMVCGVVPKRPQSGVVIARASGRHPTTSTSDFSNHRQTFCCIATGCCTATTALIFEIFRLLSSVGKILSALCSMTDGKEGTHPMATLRSTRAFFATPSLHCPDCGAPMRLLAIAPSGSAPGADEISYRCEVCSIEMKHVALQPAA
jgi:hypothetical protein